MDILPKKGQMEGFSYEVQGDDMQCVVIHIQDEDVKVLAEAGNLFYMDNSIRYTTGTGKKGLFSALGSVIKRKIAGESAFLSEFSGRGRVAFASDRIGKVVPIKLNNETILAQKDAFLCGVGDFDISFSIQKGIMAGLFVGEGFILQKISGSGIVFISATGFVDVIELKGTSLFVETGKAVAWDNSVAYSIQAVKDLKTALFGGEGLFLTEFSGYGNVVIQSINFEMLKYEILKDFRTKK